MCDVNVIGIDPAPAAGATVCFEENGKLTFKKWKAKEIKKNLEEWCKKNTEDKKQVLITWDAPLTGPTCLDDVSESLHESEFTQRILDKVFSCKNNLCPPDGISIICYCHCDHWTISQYVLGYPIMNEHVVKSCGDLPYALLHNEKTEDALLHIENVKNNKQYLLAEVHPALAMWLFLSGDLKKTETDPEPESSEIPDIWKYKGKKTQNCSVDNIERNFNTLRQKLAEKFGRDPDEIKQLQKIADADELDAYVAWLLGHLWVKGEKGVGLVGTRATGAMLLPDAVKLSNKLKRLWPSSNEVPATN